MFPTLEVRWFLPGTIPAEVEDWFVQAGGEVGPAAYRVDHYLRLEGEDGLGIKVREGRLEVKKRQTRGGLVKLHQQVTGQLEHWRKWSIVLGEAGAAMAVRLARPESWIAVEKARRLRRYQVAGTSRVIAISPTEYPDQACDWELTQARVAGKAWWTVGLEAFGRESHLEQTFQTVVAQILAFGAPPALHARHSLGYPEWLTLLDR